MVDSPPKLDRISGIWGSYYYVPKAILYLLKGDYIDMTSFPDGDHTTEGGEATGNAEHGRVCRAYVGTRH